MDEEGNALKARDANRYRDSWMTKRTFVKQKMLVIIDFGNLKFSDEKHWAGLAPTWMDLAAALKNIPIASRQFLSYISGPGFSQFDLSVSASLSLGQTSIPQSVSKCR